RAKNKLCDAKYMAALSRCPQTSLYCKLACATSYFARQSYSAAMLDGAAMTPHSASYNDLAIPNLKPARGSPVNETTKCRRNTIILGSKLEHYPLLAAFVLLFLQGERFRWDDSPIHFRMRTRSIKAAIGRPTSSARPIPKVRRIRPST